MNIEILKKYNLCEEVIKRNVLNRAQVNATPFNAFQSF